MAGAWLATLALWWRERGRAPRTGSGAKRHSEGPKPALRKILRDLDSACAVHDKDAARQALLAFAETYTADAKSEAKAEVWREGSVEDRLSYALVNGIIEHLEKDLEERERDDKPASSKPAG